MQEKGGARHRVWLFVPSKPQTYEKEKTMTTKPEKQTLYEQAGVESNKSHIKEAFSGVNISDYPYAFVNIGTDHWDPSWVMSMHGDGAGSRSTTHWLYYAVTGKENLLPYDIADALAMNGDIVAGGFTDALVFIDTISVNAKNVNKELIVSSAATGIAKTMALLANYGFKPTEQTVIRTVGDDSDLMSNSPPKTMFPAQSVYFFGGETEDLPCQLNSYAVNASVFSRMPREGVIAGNVQPGDSIFSFSSGGQALWEDRLNSGHMSNGSTLSGPVLLLEKYQEQFPYLRSEVNAFRGPFAVDQYLDQLGMTVGEALLSPTRQWAIIMKMIIERAKADGCFSNLHAIVMNTGGGQTKCLHVGNGIRYEKRVPDFLPIFDLIRHVSHESILGMLKTFNCGIGLEVIGDNSDGYLGKIMNDVTEKSLVGHYETGICLPTTNPSGGNEVVFSYNGEKIGPVR